MMNPKIRFKKSDGSDYQDWKVDNINELFGISTGKCITTAEADADGLYDVISGGTTPLCKTNKYNRNANTITVARAGTAGYVMFQTNDFYLNDKCFSLIPIDENIIDSKFGFYELKNREYDIIRLKTDNVVPTINTVSLGSVKVYYPTDIEEQTKIANFLSEIDNLIASAEHEVESTKQLKKAMLQKMFPKKGEKFPEIRFPEFTDAWEQRKVTELGKIYIGLVTTMTKHYTNEGTLLIRNSDIKDGRFEFGDTPIYLENTFAQENESRMHQIGDVITVHTGDVGTSAVITENEAKSIGFATIVTRPDTQIIVPNYLCTFLNTDKHKRWAVAISTGDGRTNYNLGDYYELVVPVPSIREQQAISSFVQNLNNLITLHQRKLDAYKKFKKAMMQKMFV